MYRYDQLDEAFVAARVAQFRDQTRRYLAGELSEEAFKPLRLQNGLYIQRHAPMLRIAIPYGVLSSVQLRALADIADRYDEGYGHFSTRQNLQLNGPTIESVPDILADLARVQMHAIQTSGNCIRNVTTDHYAGIAPDEVADPRPWAELIRQWSSLHPEFAFLPRKFKIALTGATADRAAIQVHDIGLALVRDADGQVAFDVWAGGGLGRTPIIASLIRRALPRQHLLDYLEAILRVYNRHGRRDNIYKARIKILVRAMGAAAFASEVEQEFLAIASDASHGNGPLDAVDMPAWEHAAGSGPGPVDDATIAAITTHFGAPAYASFRNVELARHEAALVTDAAAHPGLQRWLARSRAPHRQPGYAAIAISLKNGRQAPGDCTSAQMRCVAECAERFGFGEIRVTHHQNLVLPDVRIDALPLLWRELQKAGLATPNIGLVSDIIACPGGDFCQLANAKSIPIALAIQEVFADLDELFDIGELELNISGCMNSCGHHHIGHIGILGVDKKGDAFYQLSIGGDQGPRAEIGRILGPSFSEDEVPDAIERIIRCYLTLRRDPRERFTDAVRRVGLEPFKEAVYESVD